MIINNKLTYQEATDLINIYITKTLNEKEQIDDKVFNQYIADKFKNILKYLELELNHPEEFEKYGFKILPIIHEYFNITWLEKNEYYEIYRLYHLLINNHDDYLNCTLKLINIKLKYLIQK
jgi:hypothetical protein